ncbi:putative HTH-type transcriptional regulator [Mycobacterium simulans]|uniref:TetR/AcrR family transcriptional regulator n=1 Tax=Mycobacterium simulans TaxID=627089 RepID=UPI00174D54D0|nr:TetR/AcrR family transcriptional regulator [Mycobacterium simulans]SON62122.1 putative HTH-type transcriptional regulator [Mycobacterium simulans]
MVSISNEPADIGNRILRAAETCVIDFGVDRVTLAEIARRAGVSRPTVYRRWPDTQSIVADLLTLHAPRTLRAVPRHGEGRGALGERIATVATSLLDDEVVVSILRSEMVMVYITERLGRSQRILIETVANWLSEAQREGSVRPGDPWQLAAMVLLITQSAIQSAQIIRPILDRDALTTELAYALNGYLS